MPHNGRSYAIRPSGALPSTAGATGYRIDPRPRTVRAAGTTPWVPLGHTGSHGQSMVVRVPGAGRIVDLTGCYDDYTRTVADGWGQADWCLPAWTPYPGSSTRLSVVDGAGRLECDYRDDGPYSPSAATITYPTNAGYPGRIEFRMRYTGAEVSGYGIPIYAFFSPNSTATTTGAFEMYWDYTHSDIQGPMMEMLWWDNRAYSGGSWAYDYTGATIDPFDVGWLYDWWNVVYLADEYGTYLRAWRDGEDEHVRDAPTQPTDTYGAGCPQGGGETWHAWEAYSVPETTYNLTHFHMGTLANGVGAEYLEIDNLRLSGGFCCPCCDYFLRTESGALGIGPCGTWLPYGDADSLPQTSVDGDDAIFVVTPFTGNGYPGEFYIDRGAMADKLPVDVVLELQMDMNPYPLTETADLAFYVMTGTVEPTSSMSPVCEAIFRVHKVAGGDGSSLCVSIYDDRDGHDEMVTYHNYIATINSVRFMARWQIDAAGQRIRVWKAADPEPSGWAATLSYTTTTTPGRYFGLDTSASPWGSGSKVVTLGSVCWR